MVSIDPYSWTELTR